MGKILEETYRDWIPCSLFSFFNLGLLLGVFFESYLPDSILLWVSLHSIYIILSGFRFRRNRKLTALSWGTVLFFFLVCGGYTKRTAPFLSESQNWKKEFSIRVEGLLREAEIRGQAKEISLGLVLGDAKNLSREFKEDAREGGILHLFAASGLHLGILLACLYLLFQRIPFLGYYIPRFLPVIFGFLYLAALGFPVSLARAWVFSSWLLVQTVFFRKSRSSDLLIGSAGILYLWDPSRAFGVSFLLSFGAVASILLLLPCLEVCFPKASEENGLRTKILIFLKENILVSTSAGLGTLPTLVFFFGTYSFGSLGLNFILVPLSGILLPLLYLSLVLQIFLPISITKSLWFIVTKILEFLEFATVFWADSDWSLPRYYRGNSKSFALVIWIFLILFLVLWKLSRRNSENVRPLDLSGKKVSKKFPMDLISYHAWILGLFICVGLHFLLAYSSDWQNKPPVFFGDKFSFIVESDHSLSIVGKCKYSGKFLYRSIGKDPDLFCGDRDSIHEIYIEHETCLEWVLRCLGKRKSISLKFGGGKLPKDWESQGWMQIPKRAEFGLPFPERKMIRFEVGKDSLTDLPRRTKEGKGLILLISRFGKKEDPWEWNLLRKRLGIGPGWEFLGGDELPRIPVL